MISDTADYETSDAVRRYSEVVYEIVFAYKFVSKYQAYIPESADRSALSTNSAEIFARIADLQEMGNPQAEVMDLSLSSIRRAARHLVDQAHGVALRRHAQIEAEYLHRLDKYKKKKMVEILFATKTSYDFKNATTRRIAHFDLIKNRLREVERKPFAQWVPAMDSAEKAIDEIALSGQGLIKEMTEISKIHDDKSRLQMQRYSLIVALIGTLVLNGALKIWELWSKSPPIIKH